MAVWAVGQAGGLARIFVRSTNPGEVLAQMGAGETLAPVPEESATNPDVRIKLLGDMQFEIIPNQETSDG